MSPMKMFRNMCMAVYITIDVEQSSFLAKCIGFVSKMVVVIAVIAYIISTDPTARYVPDICDDPVCNNDPFLCPGYMVCEDTELPSISAAINFTTYYFTGMSTIFFFFVLSIFFFCRCLILLPQTN